MIRRHPRTLLAASFAAFAICITSCSAPQAGTGDESEAVSAGTGTQTEPGAPVGGPAPTAPQGQGGQDPIAVQRNQLRVQEYVERAERLRRQGDQTSLEAARVELLKARDLAPNNDEVARLLTSVSAELQDPDITAETFAEHQLRLAQINEQRRQAEIMAQLDAASTAMDDKNYRRAIGDLNRALLTMEIGANVNWGDLEQRARDMLARAERERNLAEQQANEAAQRSAAAERRKVELERQSYRKARVDDLLAKSGRAFQMRRFKLSQDLAFEAMDIDPTNAKARQLHSAAIKATRETRTDRYYQDMSREIQRMQEAAEELRIPQMDILHVDAATWERARLRTIGVPTAGGADPDDAALESQIASETVSGLSFTEEDGTYEEVRTRIQAITSIPIIITPAAREAIDGEGLVMVMDISAPITVENFLDLMVQKSESLAWTINHGVVQITTKALAGGQNYLDQKDVRDLTFPKTVFLPPQIRDIPSGEDDSDVPRTGGEGDEKTYFVEMDTLISNIKDATDPAYWDSEGGGVIDQSEAGFLLVTANRHMQGRVDRMLDDLRKFATTVVTIESKFLSISRKFLQQIGVDIRGTGGATKGEVAVLDDITNGLDDNASRGLDNSGTGDPAGNPASGAFFNDGSDGDVRARTENFFSQMLGQTLSASGGATVGLSFLDDLQVQLLIRAVEKREDVQELNGQNLTVLNNERGHVAVINQTAYVRDFDVEVAQAAFIADPKIDVIQDGVVLDVKPTVSQDRKKVTMELQPTVAELLRPIPTFSTSLAGTTQPVTLQLPQLNVRSFATAVTVPDGGSVLIGGLRTVLAAERRASVPVLADIPILSFFFKQDGIVDENSSLMVLVRAMITDVKTLMENQ